jgi:hypothetical protein
MNDKIRNRRNTRADYAIISWVVASLLGADAWANRETADYYHETALGFVLLFVGIGVLLFVWNAVQYAVIAKRNKL